MQKIKPRYQTDPKGDFAIDTQDAQEPPNKERELENTAIFQTQVMF